MARCETCGNDYDKAFQVSMNGTTHTFDSFECAIHALAPTCNNCSIHILGHGLEKEGTFFCWEHCAEVQRRDRPARPNRSRRRDRNGFPRVINALNTQRKSSQLGGNAAQEATTTLIARRECHLRANSAQLREPSCGNLGGVELSRRRSSSPSN